MYVKKTGRVISVALLISAAWLIACFKPYSEAIVKDTPLELTPDWTSVALTVPVRVERKHQEVLIKFTKPFKYDQNTAKLQQADGSVNNVEVQLVDENGQVYPLSHQRLLGNYLIFSRPEGLPANTSFRDIRIRSERPVQCAKILWWCYNPEQFRH